MCKIFNLYTISSILIILILGMLFNLGCEMISNFPFELASSDNLWWWLYFHVLIGHLYIFGKNCLFKSIFSIVFVAFYCWVVGVCILYTNPYYIDNLFIFFPFCRLYFHFDSVLWSLNVFNLDEVKFIFINLFWHRV